MYCFSNDAQFTTGEYAPRIGWGHSTFQHALQFAQLTRVKKLALFHHDPSHSDEELERIFTQEIRPFSFPFHVSLAREGESIDLHV